MDLLKWNLLQTTGLTGKFDLPSLPKGELCSSYSSRPHAPFSSVQFSSVQSPSRVRLFTTPWIAAHQASLSITNSRSSLRFTSIESVMPSSHLILGRPLLLLPPIPPSIRVFSNESTLRMKLKVPGGSPSRRNGLLPCPFCSNLIWRVTS